MYEIDPCGGEPLGSRAGGRLRQLRRTWCLALLGGILLAACGGADGPVTAPPEPEPPTPDPLRVLAEQRGMWIGTAVGSSFPGDARYMAVLRREFNLVTAENNMKFDAMQPSRGQFRWDRADALVDFAAQNGMRVRGHALAWHSQNPAWLNNGAWTREEAIGLLEVHIAEVVGRYRGRIAAWDVVNEAVVGDGGRRSTTESVWERSIGSDYIEIAFRAAHAADPEARLFYNDYNLEWPGPKQDAAFELVRDLAERGVPIHGIGFQAHFVSGGGAWPGGGVPPEAVLRATFDRFAALGLKVEITELDIRIQSPVTAAKLSTQAEEFRRVVKVCRESPACDTVVVWGVHDGNSWVPGTFSGYDAALLFDREFNAKPAYHSVQAYLAGLP